MKLRICHLYPDLMNLYGDRGNVLALRRRAEWHGLDAEVVEVSLEARVELARYDILFMGGGQDKEQRLICADFKKVKGSSLREAVEDGIPFLAVCGGYQLLGSYYRISRKEVLEGLGILDVYTKAGTKRMIGNTVIISELFSQPRTLVGFENHSGKTYLGPRVKPLGTVVVGFGNNGKDRTEGAVYRNTIGTYLHGPLLPKNPWFTDWLISKALERRYGKGLSGCSRIGHAEDLEERAHKAVLGLIMKRAKRTMTPSCLPEFRRYSQRTPHPGLS